MPLATTWEQIEQKGNPLLSPAYRSNGPVVFTSGCIGSDPVTGEISTDITIQTENCIANLKKVLETSGSSIDRVLKVLLFIAHPADAAAVNAVYAKHFTTKPARSCIVVGFPNPALKVELEVSAECDAIPNKL